MSDGTATERVYTLEDARREWPIEASEDDLDRQIWWQGQTAFAAVSDGDMAGLREAVAQICVGLRHHLYRDDFLPMGSSDRPDEHLVHSIWNVCVGSILYRDPYDLPIEDKKPLRLSLVVTRRYGLQPQGLGGDGSLDDLFSEEQWFKAMWGVMDRGEAMVMPEHFFVIPGASARFVGYSGSDLGGNFTDPFWHQTEFGDAASTAGVIRSSGDHDWGVRKAGDEYKASPTGSIDLDNPRQRARVVKEIANIAADRLTTGAVSMDDILDSMGLPANSARMLDLERRAIGIVASHPAVGATPERYHRSVFDLAHQQALALEVIGFLSSAVTRLGLLRRSGQSQPSGTGPSPRRAR